MEDCQNVSCFSQLYLLCKRAIHDQRKPSAGVFDFGAGLRGDIQIRVPLPAVLTEVFLGFSITFSISYRIYRSLRQLKGYNPIHIE